MKSTRRFKLVLFALNVSLVAVATHWAGCVAAPQAVVRQREPGLYCHSGWNGSNIYYDTNTSSWMGPTVNVDAKVGEEFRCVGPNIEAVGTRIIWERFKIVSGELPDGLTMPALAINPYNLGPDMIHFNPDPADGLIKGIPRERGHWVVELDGRYSTREMLADRNSVLLVKQTLIIHVTGSGEVHQ